MRKSKGSVRLAVLAMVLALARVPAATGCASDDAQEQSETETAGQAAEDDAGEASDGDPTTEDTEEPSGDDLEMSYIGVFTIDVEDAVFSEVELRADGTATYTLYSGETLEGTWAVDEEQYLTMEADNGESVSGTTMIHEDGFEIAYVGKYTAVEF